MEAQRVVVIQDASREVCWRAIRWILHGFSLKPGDMLTLVSLLHQVNNPSTFSFIGAGKKMGYKNIVDRSTFGANQRIVDDEIARKKKEYQNNGELIQIFKLFEMQKIEFRIEVDAGPSPKVVALKAAKNLNATWVILDRQMKKDKKFFLEKLSCGISRMKRDNNVEQLRGPKAVKINRFLTQRSTGRITYDEMLPGSPEGEDLFSIELFPKMSTSSLRSTKSTSPKCELYHNLEDKSKTSIKETRVMVQSPYANPNERARVPIETNGTSQDQEPTPSINAKDSIGSLETAEIFDNSICTICMNTRPMIGGKRDFSYAELLAATNGFSPENFISGAVFRGRLNNTWMIVVKEQKDANILGEIKFNSEVQALGKTKHKNVVMLLGYCSEESHKLLVYEYICNGSLNDHLSNQSCKPLVWGERMKIALGASRGLNHLHENNIIHRDIRPKNILVSHDHEPLLVGFGLAQTDYESYLSSDQRVIGTFGYLAPEYAESGKASTKTDIYAFGVVLLELITGRGTMDKRLEEKSLLGWARPLLKERKYSELMDPRITNSHDGDQFIRMVQVAEKCLAKDPQKRLSMVEVVSTLEHITGERTLWNKNKLSHEEVFEV